MSHDVVVITLAKIETELKTSIQWLRKTLGHHCVHYCNRRDWIRSFYSFYQRKLSVLSFQLPTNSQKFLWSPMDITSIPESNADALKIFCFVLTSKQSDLQPRQRPN